MSEAVALVGVIVTVTEEDIRLGKPDDCDKCAVALAILRCVPGIDWIEVERDCARVQIDGLSYKALLPAEVEEFIDAFDEGDPVHPIDFRANLQPDTRWGDVLDEEDE